MSSCRVKAGIPSWSNTFPCWEMGHSRFTARQLLNLCVSSVHSQVSRRFRSWNQRVLFWLHARVSQETLALKQPRNGFQETTLLRLPLNDLVCCLQDIFLKRRSSCTTEGLSPELTPRIACLNNRHENNFLVCAYLCCTTMIAEHIESSFTVRQTETAGICPWSRDGGTGSGGCGRREGLRTQGVDDD